MERRRSGSRLYGLFSRLSTQDQSKLPTQEKPKKGDKFLAPPSKLDVPTPAPVPKPAPSQSRPRGLWDDAFDAVSSSSSDRDLKNFANVVREEIEQHSKIIVGVQDPNPEVSPELQICRDVLQIAKAQQTKHKENEWSLSQTRKVNIGQAYGQVATYVQKFVCVGDSIAQFDPVHFGLPWAAVRLILTVSIANYESDVAVLEGLGVISQLIYRCSIFEDYYLNVQPPLADELQKGLKGPLVSLYGSIALFLLEAQRYFIADVATRVLKAVTISDRFKKLCGDIKKHEEEVHKYERLALQRSANDQYLALRRFFGAYNDHLRRQEREAVLDWMSDIDYRSHHNGVLARLMVGTGNWLFKKEQYVQWDTNPRSALLWLRGDAGTGKSTIMASLIDHFESQPRLESSEALAYFYCSRTSSDSRRQDPTEILRSVCQQLSCPMRGLPLKPAAVRIHLRETSLGSRGASFGFKECQKLFTELVNDYTHVTVLIDALDEIDINLRFELFSFLVSVVRSTKTVLKIIVSSRNESDIYDYLGGGKNYYIDSSDNAKDIEQYVKHELSRRLLFGRASEDLIMKVENILNSKAQGIFRWVELQINSLCDPEYVHCAEDVDETLYRLPETLELIYQDSLHKISRYRATSSGSMKNVLRLLLCAERPLKSWEVLAAVAPNQQGHKIFSNPMDVVRMSRSLVVLDQSSEEFRFAHLSVREFLEQHPDFSIEISQYGAAQMCLDCVLRASKLQKHSGSRLFGKLVIVGPGAAGDSFLRYATFYWPRHCKKTGSLRKSGGLKALMTALLLEADYEKAIFSSWNHDIRSGLEFSDESRELLKEHRQSASYPAYPLFLVCFYGFEEFIEPMMMSIDSNDFLNRKNVDGLTILETCAYNGHLDLTKQLLKWATTNCDVDSLWVTNLLARAARGCPDTGVIKYLLGELQGYKINLNTLIAAAKNGKCGADILSLLFDQSTELTHGLTGVMEVILENCRSADALHFLHSRFKSVIPPKAMLKETLTNPNANYKMVDLIVADFDPSDITEDLVVALLRANSNSKEKFDVLFSRNPECPTTSRTLRAATTCDTEVFQYLCSRFCGPRPDEQVLVEAMRQHQHGKAIALMLIQDNVEFSDWFLEVACRFSESGPDCLKLLLQKPEALAFGPELLETVCSNSTRGIVELLLHEFTETEITKSLLSGAPGSSHSWEIETILAQPRAFSIDETIFCNMVLHESDSARLASTIMQGLEQFEPSEELMISIARNPWCESKHLQLLSSKFETLPVTQDVLKSALKCDSVGAYPIIEQLFEHCPQKEVTEEHVCAVATRGVEMLNSLLQRKGYLDNHAVSEAIIRAAIPKTRMKGTISSAEVLRMVLSLRPSEDNGSSAVGVTKSLLTYAVSVSSEEVVRLLWDTFDGTVPVPTMDEMIIHCASNPNFSQALAILRFTIGEIADIKVSEIPNEAYIAAAKNGAFEKEAYHFLNMMFSLSRPKIIREDLMEAAAGNNRCAPALMELLISYEPKLLITENVLIAAARNKIEGESTLRLLIDHIGADVKITKPILIAAVENGRCGFNLLELLLPYAQGGILPQEVANAAAGAEPTEDFFRPSSYWSGQPTLRFVLKQPSISITEEVLRRAAGNQYLGLQFVRLLIKHPKNNLPLRQTIVEAAVGNAVHGELIVRHLLEQRPDEISLNEKIVSVAMDNKACGSLILQRLLGFATERNDHASTFMLLKAIAREENGLCDALFQAAYRDQAAMVHALIDSGADVKIAKYDIGTALHVAAFKGQLSSTKALVERGADVNAVGGPHRTALAAACEKSNLEVIQYLVNEGAEIDPLDVVGRTPLHRALGSSSTTVTDCLLTLGANTFISDRLGCSAVHHAARTGFLHGLEILVESNVSVSAKDRAGWTPLHWSARNGNIEAVQLLIRADADPQATNAHGQTPLVVAMFFGNDHLCPILSDITEVPEYPKGVKSVRNGVFPCDVCSMAIFGDRFECETCEGYDLCYRCITDKDEIHDSRHTFRTV